MFTLFLLTGKATLKTHIYGMSTYITNSQLHITVSAISSSFKIACWDLSIDFCQNKSTFCTQ